MDMDRNILTKDILMNHPIVPVCDAMFKLFPNGIL